MEQRRQDQYDSLLEEWRDSTEIEVDEKAWDKVDFEDTGVTIITSETEESSEEGSADTGSDTSEDTSSDSSTADDTNSGDSASE